MVGLGAHFAETLIGYGLNGVKRVIDFGVWGLGCKWLPGYRFIGLESFGS